MDSGENENITDEMLFKRVDNKAKLKIRYQKTQLILFIPLYLSIIPVIPAIIFEQTKFLSLNLLWLISILIVTAIYIHYYQKQKKIEFKECEYEFYLTYKIAANITSYRQVGNEKAVKEAKRLLRKYKRTILNELNNLEDVPVLSIKEVEEYYNFLNDYYDFLGHLEQCPNFAFESEALSNLFFEIARNYRSFDINKLMSLSQEFEKIKIVGKRKSVLDRLNIWINNPNHFLRFTSIFLIIIPLLTAALYFITWVLEYPLKPDYVITLFFTSLLLAAAFATLTKPEK